MPNSSTGQVAIKYGIEGPSLTITTACAASANAVGEAKNMIQNGIVDMVIAGGTESGTTCHDDRGVLLKLEHFQLIMKTRKKLVSLLIKIEMVLLWERDQQF